MTTKKSFKAVLRADAGKVYLDIPFDPNEAWGKKARHHVEGSLDGKPFAGSLGARGGRVFMPLAKELRAKLGVDAGDRVEVVLSAGEPKAAALPEELEAALGRSRPARTFFEGLSPFGRGEWIKWVGGAKLAETRQARAKQAVIGLAAGKKLPRG